MGALEEGEAGQARGLGPRCSSCGRREAVYYRSSSGEKLCGACLERSLVKTVKRGLSRLGVLRPNDHILLVIPPSCRSRGLAALRLLVAVEKGFPSRLSVLLLDPDEGLSREASEIAPEAGIYSMNIGIDWCSAGIEGCVRASRAAGISVARDIDAGVIALPTALEDHIVILVSSLMRGFAEGVADALPLDVYRGFRVVRPLYRVGLEDLAFYSYLSGIPWSDKAYSKGLEEEVARMLAPIVFRNRELAYSAYVSIDSLARVLGGGRCRVCGAPSSSEVCPICSSLGLEELLRSAAPRRSS